jgi:trimeric autotransporter adhesin
MMRTLLHLPSPGLQRLLNGSIRNAVHGLISVMAAAPLFAPIAMPAISHAQTAAPAVITSTVDNTKRTSLKGSTPPLVALSHDDGTLDDSTQANQMILVLKRSSAQQLKLDQTLSELQNPRSASYHHWLTPEAFGAQFGPAQSDITAATNWLASQGFTVNKLSKGHSAIEFSGTMGQVRAAFGTSIHSFTAPDGTTFHANTGDVQIPTALAPLVAGVAALNNIPAKSFAHVVGQASFNPKTHVATPTSNANTPNWTYPADGGGIYLVAAPGDLAVQYDINPIYAAGTKGDGETIGIVSAAGVDETMVTNYRQLFGLPTSNLPVEIVDGFDPGINGGGAGIEVNLDVDVAGSTAPNAQLYVYTGYDTEISEGIFNAAIRAVDDNTTDVISMSYGICEPTLGLAGNLLFNQIWAQAAAQGQTVIVSSGDSGGAGCDNGSGSATHGLTVSGITSTPYNVSVGGTDFYYAPYGSSNINDLISTYWNTTASANPTVSLLSYIPEQPWNNAFGLNAGGPPTTGTTSAGSGGPSSCVTGVSAPPAANSPLVSYSACTAGTPKPAWQSAPGVPADGVRDIPDVSLFAANGYNYSYYPICAQIGDCEASNVDPTTGTEQITGVGGTSASAPLMAGIVALFDQSLKSRQGNINYILYPLASSVPAVFHDVTVGSNNVNCTEGTPNCALDANGFYSYSEYSAGAGYDLASGLGSIDANALLSNWSKVSFTPTVTTLSASSTSFAHGTPITLTSVVASNSGTPTGMVSLIATSTASSQTSYGTMTLTGGTAEAVFTSLPAGTYQIYAQYGGDGTYATSISDPVTMTVTPEASTVQVTGIYYGVTSTGDTAPVANVTNNMTAPYGSFFFIDARVFGSSSSAADPDGIPTGTITVNDNGQPFTTLNLSSYGFVELQTGAFGAGNHALTFSYSGDGSFNAATSAPLNIAITKGVPQVLISLSLITGVPVGTPLTVPVEVTTSAGQLPLTGSITVTLGSQTQTISNLQQASFGGLSSIGYGTVTFDTSTPGSYTLNASYSGDSNLNPVAQAYNPLPFTIFNTSLSPTVSNLTMSAPSIGPNGTLSATVKVTGGSHIPSGFVSLLEDGNFVAILESLDATGTVVIPIPQSLLLSNGNAQFIATYLGDSYNAPSISNGQIVNVNVGDFSLNTSQAAVSMTAGNSSTSLITVGSPYGQMLTGNVSLSCSVSSPVLGCSLASSSLSLPVNSPNAVVSTTLTITSKAGTTAALAPHRAVSPWLLGGSGIMAAFCLFLVPSRRYRNKLLMLLAMVCVTLLPIAGCSGTTTYKTVTQPPVNSTSSNTGTYTATVTATSSGIAKTRLIKVVVQ